MEKRKACEISDVAESFTTPKRSRALETSDEDDIDSEAEKVKRLEAIRVRVAYILLIHIIVAHETLHDQNNTLV